MECNTSVSKCEIIQGSPYHIYGGEGENIYETIKKKKQPLPDMYDEVFQSVQLHKEFEAQQVNDAIYEEGLPSTYGELRKRKFTNLIKKWYKIIPLWVKIAIPIVTICVILAYNGILVSELNILTKVNNSATHNSSSSLSSLIATTTAKTDSLTSSKVATTISEEATTATTTWNYTNKSWYIRSDTPNSYYCETWELISTVKFQPLDLQGTVCGSIPDCLSVIDHYKLNSNENANYTFYIDMIGNIYEGRDWNCPYVSGELWIALLTNSFNILNPNSQLQLRHFYEMVSYRRAFEYFNDGVEEDFVNKCSMASATKSYCVED